MLVFVHVGSTCPPMKLAYIGPAHGRAAAPGSLKRKLKIWHEFRFYPMSNSEHVFTSVHLEKSNGQELEELKAVTRPSKIFLEL